MYNSPILSASIGAGADPGLSGSHLAEVLNLMVDFHYFLPGLQFPIQPPSISHSVLSITKLYCCMCVSELLHQSGMVES